MTAVEQAKCANASEIAGNLLQIPGCKLSTSPTGQPSKVAHHLQLNAAPVTATATKSCVLSGVTAPAPSPELPPEASTSPGPGPSPAVEPTGAFWLLRFQVSPFSGLTRCTSVCVFGGRGKVVYLPDQVLKLQARNRPAGSLHMHLVNLPSPIVFPSHRGMPSGNHRKC